MLKRFVNNLKEKFGPMNKKKDQLVKKAKDFFHKMEAKYSEKRYLDKMYDERSGRPKSYTTQHQYKDYSKTYRKGEDPDSLLGPTTGNAGASNLRKGVEAGRKRAGIKNSPQVHGVKNNLSNRGYETTNYDNDHDTYRGLHNNRNSFGPEGVDSQRWKDMVTSTSKQKDEEYRQRIDRSRSRATGKPDELTRGTKAGRQRVNRKKAAKAANGNGAKNQQYAKHVSNSRGHYGLENGRANKSRTKDVHVSYTPNSYNEYKSNDQSRAVEETRTRKEKKNKKK